MRPPLSDGTQPNERESAGKAASQKGLALGSRPRAGALSSGTSKRDILYIDLAPLGALDRRLTPNCLATRVWGLGGFFYILFNI